MSRLVFVLFVAAFASLFIACLPAGGGDDAPIHVIVVPLSACPPACICPVGDNSSSDYFDDCVDIDVNMAGADETAGCCDGGNDCTVADCSWTTGKIRFKQLLCGNASFRWNNLGSSGNQVLTSGWSQWVGPDTATGECFDGVFGRQSFSIVCPSTGLTLVSASAEKSCGGCPALSGDDE